MLPRINFKNLVFLFLVFALAACATAQTPNVNVPSGNNVVLTDNQQPVATQAPVATQPPSAAQSGISLDYSAVAQRATVETVPAVVKSENVFWTQVLPEYTRLTLEGYPVSKHLLKPQIFVYPVDGLASAGENTGKIASDLQALLGTQQAGDILPFLPLYNAAQVIHSQVQYLDFKNGKGVRFLTQFDQGPLPINNGELIYTFQGLTSDGKSYIAAVLPVNYPELPAEAVVDEDLVKDFQSYLSKTVSMLDQQPAGSFTPDLSKLDALIGSIEVK
jgi:hypothetical protein